MKLHTGTGHHTNLSEINITPFVDVVLVLLIIFMITAPLLQQGLPVELPKASAQEIKQTPQDLILTIDRQGRLFLGDEKKSLAVEELAPKLAAIYMSKENKDLLIKADQNLLYGKVVEVMASAQKAGAERIGMVTQPQE